MIGFLVVSLENQLKRVTLDPVETSNGPYVLVAMF